MRESETGARSMYSRIRCLWQPASPGQLAPAPGLDDALGMDPETGVLPRSDESHSFFIDRVALLENGEHRIAEGKFERAEVEVVGGMEHALLIEDATRH